MPTSLPFLRGLVGIVCMHGSELSHTAILARAVGMPAVGSLATLPVERLEGSEVVIDGHEGRLYVRPSRTLIEAFRQRIDDEKRRSERLLALRDLPAETRDGACVSLYANIALTSEVAVARDNGAEVVGLYRTEYPFLVRDAFPLEDEQHRRTECGKARPSVRRDTNAVATCAYSERSAVHAAWVRSAHGDTLPLRLLPIIERQVMKIPVETKPAVWGAIGGAIAMAIVGFSWGGWVTGHTAESRASDRAGTAVVAALAPICAERFKSAANSVTNMTALKKLDSWSQGDYVEKGGWSTWPGKADAAQISAVAKACASLLTV